MSRRNSISEDRKALYYVGMLLTVIGVLLFLSTFVSGIAHFGDFSNFEQRTKSMGTRAFGGIILAIIGGILRSVGARGLAGSGVILDPDEAREDLKPWTRMAGGMIKDAVDESGILSRRSAEDPARDSEEEERVKVRCRSCKALNEETARFCNQCGKEL